MPGVMPNFPYEPTPDINIVGPEPPEGLSREKWNEWLNALARICVYLDNEFTRQILSDIAAYGNMQLPIDFYQRAASVLSSHLGINVDYLADNPTALVNQTYRLLVDEESGWTKFAKWLPLIILGVIVLIIIFILRK